LTEPFRFSNEPNEIVLTFSFLFDSLFSSPSSFPFSSFFSSLYFFSFLFLPYILRQNQNKSIDLMKLQAESKKDLNRLSLQTSAVWIKNAWAELIFDGPGIPVKV